MFKRTYIKCFGKINIISDNLTNFCSNCFYTFCQILRPF